MDDACLRWQVKGAKYPLQTIVGERRRLIAHALGALALGATLGVLVGVPYDQVLGLPSYLWTVVQSAVATLVLAGAGANGKAAWKTDARGPALDVPAQSMSAGNPARSEGEWRQGNSEKVLNVYNMHLCVNKMKEWPCSPLFIRQVKGKQAA
jgi:hypothetical protein